MKECFEQLLDTPYARCRDCDTTLKTKSDCNDHLTSTSDDNPDRRSHRVSILNPTRTERIRARMSTIVDDAMTAAFEKIDSLVRDDSLTTEEARAALGFWPDFQEGYENWVEDSDG